MIEDNTGDMNAFLYVAICELNKTQLVSLDTWNKAQGNCTYGEWMRYVVKHDVSATLIYGNWDPLVFHYPLQYLATFAE